MLQAREPQFGFVAVAPLPAVTWSHAASGPAGNIVVFGRRVAEFTSMSDRP
jgi:hypothetical protein